jgi:hypothetical protein|tara:strand:+ start:698 stop:925 length:228 start_codon:yes stop_codon:yes gene_type:complete
MRTVMNVKIKEKINENLEELSPLDVKEVLDFINFLKSKKSNESDTDYLMNIPGMADSIISEAKRDLSEYSEDLDW